MLLRRFQLAVAVLFRGAFEPRIMQTSVLPARFVAPSDALSTTTTTTGEWGLRYLSCRTASSHRARETRRTAIVDAPSGRRRNLSLRFFFLV